MNVSLIGTNFMLKLKKMISTKNFIKTSVAFSLVAITVVVYMFFLTRTKVVEKPTWCEQIDNSIVMSIHVDSFQVEMCYNKELAHYIGNLEDTTTTKHECKFHSHKFHEIIQK